VPRPSVCVLCRHRAGILTSYPGGRPTSSRVPHTFAFFCERVGEDCATAAAECWRYAKGHSSQSAR
jgi:hypothetical protein